LEANVFGILPKASATDVEPILSYEAMVVETNTAAEKKETFNIKLCAKPSFKTFKTTGEPPSQLNKYKVLVY